MPVYNPLPTIQRGYIYGLTLSNNASDATNDIDIAAGEAASDATTPVLMVLASALTKRLDAAWSVGTGNGGLDTGSIADTTYHVFLIQRSDIGTVDVLFSTSPTAPTMPANYDRKRRIGSIIRASSAILGFRQTGNIFKHTGVIIDRNTTSLVTDTLLTLSVPAGVKVWPILNMLLQMNGAGSGIQLLGDGDAAAADFATSRAGLASEWSSVNCAMQFVTNTAAQLRFTLANASGSLSVARVYTLGWFDPLS